MPQIDLSILNQRQTPAFYADVLANRPAAGFIGRIFVSTNTFEFYRDNGTGWDLIGGPGAGTITGSGAAGQITYWNGASTVTGDNGLFYDAVNDRLGIGTITPGAAIDAHSTQSTILQLNQTAINDTRIAFQLSGSALWRLGNLYNGGANDFELFDVIGAQAPLTVKKTTGQVLIGTTTVGSGKLVVASAFGDNGIQVVGATSPSLRIDNAATGPTKRVGLGIATNTNNFIQGSADRDFCIFNGSTTAASPILFGVYDAGLTNVQEAARISAARNFLINTSVDAGFRLDVNGTSIIRNSLTITNPSFGGGDLTISKTALNTQRISGGPTGTENITFGPSNRIFLNASQVNVFYLNGVANIAAPAGTPINLITNVNAVAGSPTSGVWINGTNNIQSNGTDSVLLIEPNINAAVGTTNGLVRGIYYNPTLTSLIGTTHRAIETTTGDVTLNTTSGSTLIGTTTNAGFKLDVNGTARVSNALTLNGAYTNSSDVSLIISASLPGINLRAGSNGRFSIITNFASGNTTSFAVATGTNNPTQCVLIDHATNLVTFSGAINISNTVAAAVAAPSTHKVSILIGGVQYYLLASNV